MKRLIGIMIALTVIQTLLYGFSLTLILVILARGLFALKAAGIPTKLSVTVVMEILAIFAIVIVPLFLNTFPTLWSFVGTTFLGVISMFIMWYDEEMFVYVEEDV